MSGALPSLVLGALVNLAVAVAIVRLIYYPVTRDRVYIPSFLAFNTIVFLVLSFLSSVELSVGVGFGLFAIFSVLNYRTEQMPIREMTYLFTLIALPVINSFLTREGMFAQVLVANAIIVALLWVLEKGWGFDYLASKRITYDTIGLITPASREELIADLRKRTGLPIRRVEVGRIDFLRDTARIRVFYDDRSPESNDWVQADRSAERASGSTWEDD